MIENDDVEQWATSNRRVIYDIHCCDECMYCEGGGVYNTITCARTGKVLVKSNGDIIHSIASGFPEFCPLEMIDGD